MALYVGTSGWAYPEWRPDFYPKGTPPARFLEHYARALGACEVNATFYRAQSEQTLRRWAAAVPRAFRFTAKVHRSLTYSRWFVPDEDGRLFWKEFVDHLAPLNGQLVALLVQFPPHKERDDRALEALLAGLPPGPTYAFEFRSPSWDEARVAEALAARGACVVVSDGGGDVPRALPPRPIANVRLRADRYAERARAGWCDLLQREAQRRDVYAFTKHRHAAPTDVFGGVGLARWLHQRAHGSSAA
jgi:uncharacterized protein YecE (DUF72 family)